MKNIMTLVMLAALSATMSLRAEEPILTQIDLSSLDASKAIAGTTASGTPSAYKNRAPVHAFNGDGIDADGHHGIVADSNMYMVSANDSGDFPLYIQVDLSTVHRLDAVRLYNFNFNNGSAYTMRGVRKFELYVSTNQSWSTSASAIRSGYTKVLEGELPQASGTASETGTYLELAEPVNARFVALVALSDWDDKYSHLNYNGISEIQLFSGGDPLLPPEPPAPDPERTPIPEISLCCVGDSITEGVSNQSYRPYLAELLRANGFTNVTWKGSRTTASQGGTLVHEAISGNSAEQIFNNYVTNAVRDKADVLLLHAGHNHDLTKETESAILAGVTNAHARIIAAARAQNPNATILYAKVITSSKLPKYGYIPALNEAIGHLAAQLTTAASPIVVVNMAEDWDPATLCVDDHVHPTEAGARLMADRWFAALLASPFLAGTEAFVEAEAFTKKGGWCVDPQFVDVMGSPYLLAHGRGIPVAAATTPVTFGFPGLVRAWVRTRDWTPDWEGEKPGRFRLSVGDAEFPVELGVAPADWGWIDAGVLRVPRGDQTVKLLDQTGFEGRCDAVYLTSVATTNPPPNTAAELAAWRAEKRGEAGDPTDVVTADLVVVGGGIAGTCAAIAAADEGLTVAVIQDRPMLGGNASDEIRVRTEREGDEHHWIVRSVRNNVSNGGSMAKDDANRAAVVARYPGITVHSGWRAYGAITNAARKIVAVDARDVVTGARRRFVAPYYVDCTGDGWVGYWAGADYHVGREAKSEYNEPTHGQDKADSCTMGNTLLWSTKMAAEPYAFPAVPWATKVSGTRADTKGTWQWEAGLGPEDDTIYGAEALRDRLFRAIYGSFSNAKAKDGNENLVFNFLHYIAGKRESRRILGDYVVRERDIIDHVQFEDAIGIATWSVDLHRMDGSSGFIAATTHYKYGDWWMPYRSLCCRDVPNLFMAGRCASYTHVAFGSSRVMHAGGQQGVAVGYAASLCKKYGCRPREIYRDSAKMTELQGLINKRNEYSWPTPGAIVKDISFVIVDNADRSGVEIRGDWKSSDSNSDRYGNNYLHNNRVDSDDLWVRYTPAIPSNGVYDVSLFWNGDSSRGSNVVVEVVYDGGTSNVLVNMQNNPKTWSKIGVWPFAVGTSGSVRITTKGQTGLIVVADAVKFSITEVFPRGEDTDRNGLPDAWERRYFLQLDGTDPDADPDGDGYTNLEEYLRGSDPTDPGSPLLVSGIAPQDVELGLSWKGLAGRTYQVWSSSTLDGTFEPFGEPIPGTDGEMSVTLTKDASPSRFYRIKDLTAREDD